MAFTLCGNCHNHYDAAYQSPRCGQRVPHLKSDNSDNDHRVIATPPVEEHVELVRRCKNLPPRKPGTYFPTEPQPVPLSVTIRRGVSA